MNSPLPVQAGRLMSIKRGNMNGKTMNYPAHTITRALIALLFMASAALTTSCTASQAAEQANKSPQITGALKVIDIVGKREWKPSEESSLICAMEDSEENGLTYVWSAEKGSIEGKGKTVSWTAPDTLGDYSVTVKVISNRGEEVTYSKKFKVTDDPYHNKTADKTIYLNLSLTSSDTVSVQSRLRSYTTAEIQCVVEDTDPADLTYTWSSPSGRLLGDGITEGKSSRVGWIAPGQAGSYTVSVVVTDKEGRQTKGEVVIEVLCCRDP